MTTSRQDARAEDAERWCAGLSHVGTRALSVHERVSVMRRMEGARRRARLWWLVSVSLAAVTALVVLYERGMTAVPLVGIGWALEAGVAGLWLALTRGRRLPRMLAAVGASYLLVMAVAEAIAAKVLGSSVGVGLSDLTTNVAFAMVLLGVIQFGGELAARLRLHQGLSLVAEDLRSPTPVDRFEGRTAPSSPDPGLTRLLAAPAPDLDDGRRRLEVLRGSGLLVRANGRPVHAWITASVAALAPARLHAYRVDLPKGVARDTEHRLQRRALSPPERQELLSHARRLTHGFAPALIGPAATALFVGTRLVVDGARADLTSPGSWLWYGLSVSCVLLYVGRLRAGRKLRTDAELRWVVTVHGDEQNEHAVPRMELLPVSQLVWTEDGRPPAWRAH